MKIFYDDDADLDIIKNLKVSVIGYGSQGHAHSNNLHDSGVDVTVGLRKDSSSWTKANDAGLKVAEVEEAVSGADLVMILAPMIIIPISSPIIALLKPYLLPNA